MKNLENWHQEEQRCIKRIKELAPDHPILNIMFSSTYKACEEYWKVLRELTQEKQS